MEEEKDLKDVIHEIEEENEKEALEKEKLEEAKVPETIEEVKQGELELIDVVKLYEYFVYFSKSNLISNDIT